MVYRLDLETYEISPYFTNKNFKKDLSHIKTEYMWYDSYDGTKVPITILYNSKIWPSV